MTGKPMKLPKQAFHSLNSRLAALGPVFSPYRGDHKLWAPQKLSIQGYSVGLMDTGRDAVLQSGLFGLKGSSSYQDVTVCLWKF